MTRTVPVANRERRASTGLATTAARRRLAGRARGRDGPGAPAPPERPLRRRGRAARGAGRAPDAAIDGRGARRGVRGHGRPAADRRRGHRSPPLRPARPTARRTSTRHGTSSRRRHGRQLPSRGVPVLGICRGLQAINVFSGGSLLQHVEGHAGPAWGSGPAATHPLRLVEGTRLASLLGPGRELEVNAYHHQGILEADLAPGLRAAAWADSAAGPLVEGVEAAGDGRFVVGVQCHPERTESTPGRVRAAVRRVRCGGGSGLTSFRADVRSRTRRPWPPGSPRGAVRRLVGR